MSEPLLDLLEELDRLLQDSAVSGTALADWQTRFDVALESADRSSPTWPKVLARSHALATRLETAASQLAVRREEIRRELSLQDRGARALKGYRPT
jgi:ABC-type transporter Mla subunit MlaD